MNHQLDNQTEKKFSTERTNEKNAFEFPTEFNGQIGISENRNLMKLRITSDKLWMSAFDIIEIVGGQIKNSLSKTWDRIKIEYHSEVIDFQFSGQGQKKTPCIRYKINEIQELIKLFLPGTRMRCMKHLV